MMSPKWRQVGENNSDDSIPVVCGNDIRLLASRADYYCYCCYNMQKREVQFIIQFIPRGRAFRCDQPAAATAALVYVLNW